MTWKYFCQAKVNGKNTIFFGFNSFTARLNIATMESFFAAANVLSSPTPTYPLIIIQLKSAMQVQQLKNLLQSLPVSFLSTRLRKHSTKEVPVLSMLPWINEIQMQLKDRRLKLSTKFFINLWCYANINERQKEYTLFLSLAISKKQITITQRKSLNNRNIIILNIISDWLLPSNSATSTVFRCLFSSNSRSF